MRSALLTANLLVHEELFQGRKDENFRSKIDWGFTETKVNKKLDENDILAFDCGQVKGHKFKIQVNIAPFFHPNQLLDE